MGFLCFGLVVNLFVVCCCQFIFRCFFVALHWQWGFMISLSSLTVVVVPDFIHLSLLIILYLFQLLVFIRPFLPLIAIFILIAILPLLKLLLRYLGLDPLIIPFSRFHPLKSLIFAIHLFTHLQLILPLPIHSLPIHLPLQLTLHPLPLHFHFHFHLHSHFHFHLLLLALLNFIRVIVIFLNLAHHFPHLIFPLHPRLDRGATIILDWDPLRYVVNQPGHCFDQQDYYVRFALNVVIGRCFGSWFYGI